MARFSSSLIASSLAMILLPGPFLFDVGFGPVDDVWAVDVLASSSAALRLGGMVSLAVDEEEDL